MKKTIFSIITIMIIILSLSISVFANITVFDGNRTESYIAEVPISMNLQVGNTTNSYFVGMGSVTPSSPLVYYPTDTNDRWTVNKTISKTDFPTVGEVLSTTATFYSDTILIDIMYANLTYHTDYQSTCEFSFTANGSEFIAIQFILEAATNPVVYFITTNNSKVTAFEDPEFYIYSLKTTMNEVDLREELGVFADAFSYSEETTTIQPTIPNPVNTLINYELIRYNEGDQFRALLKSALKTNTSNLYNADGYYQFRPTFFGNGFIIPMNSYNAPVIQIGSNTAKVIYNCTFGYYYKGLNDAIYYAVADYNYTNTSATGRVNITPTVEELKNNIPSTHTDILPYIFIINYNTECSIRRASLAQEFTIECRQGEMYTTGYPLSATDFYHWILQLTYPVYEQIPNTGDGVGDLDNFGSLGSFLSTSLDGFFNTPLFGTFSIGNIVITIIMIAVVFAILKYFVGG